MQPRRLDQDDRAPRILIAGGHRAITGGLEIFIARARQCLGLSDHCFTETPGRDVLSVVRYGAAMIGFTRQVQAYDTVWLHYGSAFDLAYLAIAKVFGKKVAVTPHLGAGWRSMRKGWLRTLCNRVLGSADRIFTLHRSQPQTLGFSPSLTARCMVMGTFLPKALLETETAQRSVAKPLRLVHVARLSAAKGSFAFLDVCAELARRGVAFEAAMIGAADVATVQALKNEIATRALDVAVTGALSQDALMNALGRADVLVNLSLQDAYPLTVIEAVLCGVVPVVSRLPGTEDLAADAPAIGLVDGQDGIAAAARICAMDFEAVVASAAALRQKFTWSAQAERYRGAFQSLHTPGPSVSAVVKASLS